jgi:putative endopeptidase
VSAATETASGLDLAWRRPDVRPQDDLFRHVNGRWLDEVPIPEDRATCGTLRDLRKIGDLYASFLDEGQAERLGITPLRPDLDRIARIGSVSSLAHVLGRLQLQGMSGAFSIYVIPDARDSDRYLLHVTQSGLGLPDESYYRAERFAAVRASYRAHMEAMLRLANAAGLADPADSAGLADPEDAAGRIIALETRIASWHWDRARARDVVRGYTLVGRAGLDVLAPCFDWDAWLDGLGAPASALSEVVVRQPGFLRSLSAALQEAASGETTLADWRSWLSWRLLRATSPLLSRAFAGESFAFYETALAGVPRRPERWKHGLRVVETALGEALSRLYVAEHFPPRSRELVLELVARLVEAHRRGIEALDWMSPETKARALGKLAAFAPKIGYPDRWRDYSAAAIRRGDLVGNVRRAHAAELGRQLARIGGPVDRGEWLMTPQTVNASYHPGMNQIFFPAAILQPPLFSPEADPAVNYGAIGAVIGHEIGHGFDDQGSKYDGAGNLADWWTEADRAAFDERGAALIAQFDALESAQAPGQHVNGTLTVGENIGDLGGLTMAYRAYLLSLGGAEPPVIDGLTGPLLHELGADLARQSP